MTHLNLRSYLLISSLFIVVLGSLWKHFSEWSGIINLEIGHSANMAQVYDGDSSNVQGQVVLPFSVQLNDFSYSTSPPSYQIELLKADPQAIPNPHSPMIINDKQLKTYPLVKQKRRKIPETDYYFRLTDFYPNFGFNYGYTDQIDTIHPLDPGIMLKLMLGQRQPQLQLRANENNSLRDPHMNAPLEFYWNIPDDIKNLVKYEQYNFQDSLLRILFIGMTEEVIYEFQKGVIKEKLERDKTYYFPDGKQQGFQYQFVFPDAQYITAVPGTIDKEMNNPVAKLEIWQKDWDRADIAYVYPAKRGGGSRYKVKGTDFKLGLEKIEENLKAYRTNDLSLIDPEGKEILSQDIAENENLKYKGYRFNQIAISNESIDYPGISVTYQRGIYLIYLGLAGVLLSGLSILFGLGVPKY
ncbi:MAG: hypothetical protein KJP00_12125 [Bacteroidia bacterium]|nr:hypothetical protein [Bacteroidia bacterium]